MPKKAVPKNVNIRLSAEEVGPILDDAKALEEFSGFAVTLGGYTKRAVTKYARLRKMELVLRDHLADGVAISVGGIKEILS